VERATDPETVRKVNHLYDSLKPLNKKERVELFFINTQMEENEKLRSKKKKNT